MGQISLPRLEKINTTMFWESGLLYKNQSWAPAKTLMLHKLLIRHFFVKSFFIKKYKWSNKVPSNFLTSFFNKYYFKHLTFKNYKILLKKNSLTVVNQYIYQFNDKYTTVVLFKPKTNLKTTSLRLKTSVTNKRHF